MAYSHRKKPPVNLAVQMLTLKKRYANIEMCKLEKGRLICVMNITPSTESWTYKVRIIYTLRNRPEVFLLSPKLREHDGKNPPHLYPDDSAGNPSLCIYYPKYYEWESTMLLADSFIPWISTWLLTYENWLITGTWHYPEITHGA